MDNQPDFSARQIRQQLLSFSIALLVLSGVVSLTKAQLWLWPTPLSMVILGYAIWAPEKLKFLVNGMNTVHNYIGKLSFGILFFLFITPLSWIIRMTRSSQIPLALEQEATSYWNTPEREETLAEDFEKQF